jgi:Flp pilus assembly protein TadG
MVLNRRGRWRGDSGVSLILVALCMVGILAVAAVVVDLGNARQIRRELQGGVDAASLAGAQELPATTDAAATRYSKQTAARNTAMVYALHNLVGPSAVQTAQCTAVVTCTDTVGGVSLTVTTPWNKDTSVPAQVDDQSYLGYVYVQACENTPTFFARVVQQSSPRVCRTAVARYTNTTSKGDYGLVATDPHSCSALQFEGNSDTILTSNGAVMVNSDCASGNAQALDSSGSSWQLKFLDGGGNTVPGYVGVVGGATLAPCDPVTQTTKCTITSPTTGISAFGDPLSGLTAPAKPVGAAKSCPKNGGGAITPGYFSDCVIVNGDVTMQPGIYWLDGNFSMNGGSLTCVDGGGQTCAGNGILIYLNAGALNLAGNGKLYLPPFTSSCTPKYVGSCYDGLSVWQTSSSQASINGTNDFSMGTVYIPNAQLKANGSGGGAQVNITGLVVAKTVDISGTFDFNIKVPATSPDIPQNPNLGLEK